MSTAEQLPEWEPNPRESEVERSRREDPGFPELRARVLARVRGQVYDANRHGPFPEAQTPRRQRVEAMVTKPVGNLSEVIERFMARGPLTYRSTLRPDELAQRRERKDLE